MTSAQTPRNRSIYSSLLIPLLLLVLGEVLLFTAILIGSGALDRLSQNDHDILNQQISSRRDSMQNYFVGTVGDLLPIANSINGTLSGFVEEGVVDLDLLDSSASASLPLFDEAIGQLVGALRSKEVSGAFVILNTHDLSALHESGAYGKKQGIYIRDMDPAATPSPRNEDLVILRAPTEIVQSSGITTDNDWKPQFDFAAGSDSGAFDFFYLPWQTAYEAESVTDASDFACWSASPLVGVGDDPHCVAYVIPLVLPDGTVYGVVGVDLTVDYLASLLPYSELFHGQGASYALLTYDDEQDVSEETGDIEARVVAVSGNEAVPGLGCDERVSLSFKSGGEYTFATSSGPYYVGVQPFRLYSSNTPFENKRWAVAGVISEAMLDRFVNHVRTMIAIASILMTALGIAGSVLAARSVSKPLRQLSSDVSGAQVKNAEMPDLARTGIVEVDQLTGAITKLSHDIASVRKLEQQRIEHERDYDLLTGLMNRRALYREAGKLFATPSLVKHAALLMLDLDNLKELNDTYGHDLGDKYIYQAARCFEEEVPDDVIVVRVSGDEFFLLFYGYESNEEIIECIERLKAAIPNHSILLPGGESIAVHASGGVAFYPDDSTEFPELMRLADFAMYQAKLAGKDDIGYFDMVTYQEQSSVRHAIDELEGIIADPEQVDYHFQPIFDIHAGSVFAYEALMRVETINLRSPADLVMLARQEKRLTEVERITWQRSFACFSALRERGEVAPGAYLFINSFANLALSLEEMAELSSRYPNIMGSTVIEITEAENMDDEATSTKRAIPGFSGLFALDDYGSGYNSEIMLLDLKPKFVKVDITIVRDIDTSTDKQRIMSNVVEYAHERDMLIIAEGIETASELTTCMEIGVDLAQGFFLALPARIPSALSAEAADVISGKGA